MHSLLELLGRNEASQGRVSLIGAKRLASLPSLGRSHGADLPRVFRRYKANR